MTTLIVPYSCDGDPDRVCSEIGFRQSGSDWIGDCPACKGSEALTVRPSGDGHRGRVLCVCRCGCVDAMALRTALGRILGPGTRSLPARNTPPSASGPNFGGALPRKRE